MRRRDGDRDRVIDAVASVPIETAARIASAHCSLLLTGETGVGKGHLASWVHDHSRREDAPFVPVNCGALPEGIIDSHLFGHARGSFSDAHQDHVGLVRSAEGGTLFLDEVGELPLGVQMRLLRLLEEREVQPVGCARPLSVDVRIIAATGCDLQERVRQGRFRVDLFYRLNVIHLRLAPLRERINEIPSLLEEFNRHYAGRFGRPALRFGASALRFLRHYGWPGNVRQLRSVVERLYVLCPDTWVTVDALRRFGQIDARPAEPRPLPRRREARLAAVRNTIAVCGGNVSRAAAALGVHRSTVHRWLAAAS